MFVSTHDRLPFSPANAALSPTSPGKLRTTHNKKVLRNSPYLNRSNSCGDGCADRLIAFTKAGDSALTLVADQMHGIIVSGIDRAEPAAMSGLLVGDRIVAINGVSVSSDSSAFKILDAANEGQEVQITVSTHVATHVVMLDKLNGELGLSVSEAARSSRGVPIHSVQRGSLADVASLGAGDTILSVNERLVSSHKHAVALMDSAKGEVRLVVSSGGARPIRQGSFKYMRATFGEGSCGMTLKSDTDGAIKVKAVDAGSPALKLGVQPGSVVLAIAGTSVSGMSHAMQVDLMRKALRPMQLLLTVYNTDDDSRL